MNISLIDNYLTSRKSEEHDAYIDWFLTNVLETTPMASERVIMGKKRYRHLKGKRFRR